MSMDEQMLSWLPWAVLLLATLSGLMRHITYLLRGHGWRRVLLPLLALLALAAAWSLVVISAGPAPVLPRAQMLRYIRLLVLAGGVLWLAADAVAAALALRRNEMYRNST